MATSYTLNKLKQEIEGLKNDRKELVKVLEEIIEISDRKHDVWDTAKQVIAKVKESYE